MTEYSTKVSYLRGITRGMAYGNVLGGFWMVALGAVHGPYLLMALGWLALITGGGVLFSLWHSEARND